MSEQPKPMIRPWSEIVSFYEDLLAHDWAVDGMLELVCSIQGSRYADHIFGWTSVANLAITQSRNHKHTDIIPYLLISPAAKGTLEFRYIDTNVETKQWRRVVPEGRAFLQLERFFEQLRWFN